MLLRKASLQSNTMKKKNHESFGLFNLEKLRKIFTILLLKRKWCSGSTSVSEAESGGSIPLFLDHHNKKCKNLHFFCFVTIMGNENFIHSVYKNANYGFNHDSTIPSSSSTSSSKRWIWSWYHARNAKGRSFCAAFFWKCRMRSVFWFFFRFAWYLCRADTNSSYRECTGSAIHGTSSRYECFRNA